MLCTYFHPCESAENTYLLEKISKKNLTKEQNLTKQFNIESSKEFSKKNLTKEQNLTKKLNIEI